MPDLVHPLNFNGSRMRMRCESLYGAGTVEALLMIPEIMTLRDLNQVEYL